jgi:menaquinone-specific isochorismate synthase
MRLKNVQHLITPIRGTLSKSGPVIDLVRLLHPTPAVGGHPEGQALENIREIETHHRGWYAAPIGLLSAADQGEFVVALRSALIHDRNAKLFAGCGVVKESTAESEFTETEHKFQAMLKSLGVILPAN